MAFALFGTKVGKQIEELKSFVATAKTADIESDYNKIRAQFNLYVSGALAGLTFKQNKDGLWTTNGWNALPSTDELIEIMLVVDEYITTVEPRFLTVVEEDDMGIVNPMGRNIPEIDDIDNRRFKEILVMALNKQLSKEDFLILARLAAKLRKHNYRLGCFWAAGITFAIAASIGIYLYNKNRDDENRDCDTAEYDDVGSDVVITVDDDMPIVIVADDVTDVTVID